MIKVNLCELQRKSNIITVRYDLLDENKQPVDNAHRGIQDSVTTNLVIEDIFIAIDAALTAKLEPNDLTIQIVKVREDSKVKIDAAEARAVAAEKALADALAAQTGKTIAVKTKT